MLLDFHEWISLSHTRRNTLVVLCTRTAGLIWRILVHASWFLACKFTFWFRTKSRLSTLHWHLVSSQTGLHFGEGASHRVWHCGGAQTVSQVGHELDSHISFGHLTEQTGRSQWTVHWAHLVSSHCIWHRGLSQIGWHTAGHIGSSHCQRHSGWQVSSEAAARAIKATKTTRDRSFIFFGILVLVFRRRKRCLSIAGDNPQLFVCLLFSFLFWGRDKFLGRLKSTKKNTYSIWKRAILSFLYELCLL